MALRLGDTAPNFKAETTEGPIDSLELTSHHQVATPVNWRHGEDVIVVPAVTNEQAREKFPGGWREERPYLRYVPDPTT